MEEPTSLGKDIKLKFARSLVDVSLTPTGDLDTVSGFQNLSQAIILRLLVGRGELEELGHPEYGSKLHELFGQPNTERTREEVKRIVIECLNQEPRIKEILNVNPRPVPNNPSCLEIELTVVPVEGNIPLNIIYPFNLEVE